ncbi:MAG: RNA pyrophosphohydrolase [Halocynthiibacter sp.]
MTPQEIAKLPYRPCAGIVLVNPNGLIFAGQRLDSSAAAWQMPQGGIESGEDARAAALRELREETGVHRDLVAIEAEIPGWLTYNLPADLVPNLWGGRYRGQKQRWFLMRFLGVDADIRIETKYPEFSKWRWIGPDEITDHIVPFKRDLYRQILAAFHDQLHPQG